MGGMSDRDHRQITTIKRFEGEPVVVIGRWLMCAPQLFAGAYFESVTFRVLLFEPISTGYRFLVLMCGVILTLYLWILVLKLYRSTVAYRSRKRHTRRPH